MLSDFVGVPPPQDRQPSPQQHPSKSPPSHQPTNLLPQVAPNGAGAGADGNGSSNFSLPSLSTPPPGGPGSTQDAGRGGQAKAGEVPMTSSSSVHFPAIALQGQTSSSKSSFPSGPPGQVPNSQIVHPRPLEDPMRFAGAGRPSFNEVHRPTGVPHGREMGRPGMRPPGGNSIPPGGRLPPGNFPRVRPPGEMQQPPGMLPGPPPANSAGRLPPGVDFPPPPGVRPGLPMDIRPPGEMQRPPPFHQPRGMPSATGVPPAGGPRRPMGPPPVGTFETLGNIW